MQAIAQHYAVGRQAMIDEFRRRGITTSSKLAADLPQSTKLRLLADDPTLKLEFAHLAYLGSEKGDAHLTKVILCLLPSGQTCKDPGAVSDDMAAVASCKTLPWFSDQMQKSFAAVHQVWIGLAAGKQPSTDAVWGL